METAGAEVFKRIYWKTGWPRQIEHEYPRPVTYIGMGVNIGTHGERTRLLKLALLNMNQLAATRVLAVSSLYETPPWGVTNQDPFYNCVAAIHTALLPRHLLDRLKSIESQLGRKHRQRWGPREIDLDIIISGNIRITTQGLIIPHKHMAERDFVLVPLCELSPHAQLPGGRRVSRL